MLKRALQYLTLSLVGFLVFGCASTDTPDSHPVPDSYPTPAGTFTFPLMDLTSEERVIPLPNDLLRDPTTGRLAFPGVGEPFDSANSLDGFSTSGALIIPFKGSVRADTVNNDTLPVFNATTGQKALMTYSVSENAAGSVVTAAPVRALDPATKYVVVLTSGIRSADSDTAILSDNLIDILKNANSLVDGSGNSTDARISATQAAALEPVRAGYQPVWAAAEQLTSTHRKNIPLAFAFTTQSLFSALPNVREEVVTANAPLANANPAFVVDGIAAAQFAPVAMGHDENPGGFSTTPPFNDETPGNPSNLDYALAGNLPTVERLLAQQLRPGIPSDSIGRIHVGSVEVPIYRNDPINGFWANPPVQTGTQTVPFVLFLPNSVQFPDILKGQGGIPGNPLTDPNPPVPVAIFQHGITGNKFQAAALANAFNSQGIALIAIDLELHGDLARPTPSNDPTVSGANFINLQVLRNSRDNIRQSVVNLYALTHAITSGQTNIDSPPGAPAGTAPELGAPGINAAFPNPFFISISLGSIVGDVFVATEPNISRSVLNVGGARIASLLLNSETFGPRVREGLAASAGIEEGTARFAQFFLIAQTVVDDADPVNYADQATSGALRGGAPAQILQQVNTTDAVVPPSAQYDMAIQHANGRDTFSQVDAIVAQALINQVASPFTGIGMYEIPNAGHGALLDPTAGPTTQIVTQALTYLGTGAIANTGIRARSAVETFADSAEDLANYANAIKF